MKGWTYVRTPYGQFCQNQNFLDAQGAIHSTKIQTGPTGKSGPSQRVDHFYQDFSIEFGPKFPEI